MIGRFARRAMELGVSADRWYGPGVHSKVEGGGSIPPERPSFFTESAPVTDEAWKSLDVWVGRIPDTHRITTLASIRLIEVIRRIDPDLAHMIESLAPVYLVVDNG